MCEKFMGFNRQDVRLGSIGSDIFNDSFCLDY